MKHIKKILAIVTAAMAVGGSAQVEPEAVYSGGLGGETIKLRIANGGAGQSGLIKELANAYIKYQVEEGEDPFKVAWYKSDTTYSIQYLKSGDVDVGITYNAAAEKIAISQGVAESPSYYAFRDHFLLIGPPSNPANISKSDDILSIFASLHEAAEGEATEPPVRFLSRFDKSATNIKETLLWAGIGQVPWATAYSTWYHQFIAFPIQALEAAIKLEEYTITDRGTILSLDSKLRNQTVIYKAGSDKADDLLLNPAHLLVGKNAPNPEEATKFAKWLVSKKGQAVITGFKKYGEQLYTGAPEN
ncbi:hypothetical protein EDB81DRAFT_858065 [Dactylonectria macrodidyma]|uniref:PBP domain-containing protein n=1 Tax=Dactylonectria macrodidyma TaxID=307937 RepID=A0A9P9EMU8_9HYPO|nr:hypothetical protein EDB81DRAFT_858065 [Dactylonectria macrodidyma]